MRRIYTPPTPFGKKEVIALIIILVFVSIFSLLIPYPYNIPFGVVGWIMVVALLGNLLL